MADIELLTTRHAKEIIDNDNKNKNEIINSIASSSSLEQLFNGKLMILQEKEQVEGKGFVLAATSKSQKAELDGVDIRITGSSGGIGAFIPFAKTCKNTSSGSGVIEILVILI